MSERHDAQKTWISLLFTKHFVDGRICEHTKRISVSQGGNASSRRSHKAKATVKQKADMLKLCSVVVITGDGRPQGQAETSDKVGILFCYVFLFFSVKRGEQGEGNPRDTNANTKSWIRIDSRIAVNYFSKLFESAQSIRETSLLRVPTPYTQFVIGRRAWFREISDSTWALRFRLWRS